MPRQVLYIFAVNAELEGRHTYLSRSNNEQMTLPDLAGWLGVRQGGLDTDEIELFPVSDLAGMALSDYVASAFDLEENPSGQALSRMNALDGHVLLIPEVALAGSVEAKPELTLIARLPMAKADHSTNALEPADVISAVPSDADQRHSTEGKRVKKYVFMVVVLIVITALALFVLGR